MRYDLLADAVLVFHLAFVLFVVLGGFLVLRGPRFAWAHLPVAAWGSAIEFGGWTCPLTPLEQRLRALAGEGTYGGGFVEHYVTAWLYPYGLTRSIQVAIGAFVLLLNLAIYAYLVRRTRSPGV